VNPHGSNGSANSPTLDAALACLNEGLWPVAIRAAGEKGKDKVYKGKEPIAKAWGLKRQTEDELRGFFDERADRGAGVCLGPRRGPGGTWLADLEGDGDGAAACLARLYDGATVRTRGWKSARGGHALFIVDGPRLLALLAAAGAEEDDKCPGVWHLAAFPDLEWRVGGFKPDGQTIKQVQSVIPPTLGDDKKPRVWNRVGTIADLPESVYETLEALAERAAIQGESPTTRPTAKASSNRKTLDDEIAEFGAKTTGNRHAYLLKMTMRLASLVKAGRLDEQAAVEAIKDGARANGMESEGRMAEVEEAWRSAMELADPAKARRTTGDDRPKIEITTERHIVVEQSVEALARDPEIYCRGGSLGIVVEEENATAKLPGGVELSNAKGAARFLVLSRAAIGCRLTRNAQFFRWAQDKNGEAIPIDIHPPDWCIESVHTWGHYPGIPAVQTICQCPYVRGDGSIPDPGFDASIGALYRPSVALAEIPDRPSREDAFKAADRLYELTAQFPWGDGFDQAVWLAALLTAIQRPVISGAVPGFAFTGNVAGTGKGLLIDVIGIAVWGHPVPTRPYPYDRAEAAKVKLSLALAGVPAVHFDNLSEGGSYGSSVLDSALTTLLAEDRILGVSRESGPVPLRPVWMISGNNISPSRDAYRRWLPCNLISNLENPHLRADVEIADLRQHVAEHRAEFLRDALTILKAHAIAGRPVEWLTPLGSFEEWDQVIRGAVYFAVKADCLETQRKAADDAPERIEKLQLLHAWHKHQNDCNFKNGMTAREALDAVRPAKKDDPSPQPEFYSVLAGLSKEGGLPSVRELGNRIKAMQSQNVGGFRFVRKRDEHHAAKWLVELVR
jgi:putative DNA primase/helicase